MAETARDPGRLAVLAKIEDYEKRGLFARDVEDDPSTIPLLPDQVDYLNEKLSSRFWMKVANSLARGYINGLLRRGEMVIREVTGIEHFVALRRTGTIITCNHFNAFDNFAVYKAIEKHLHHRELNKVCREGNYTNFPGFYGFLFKHCNTLPLSSNASTMRKFLAAVKELLARGEQILIYPEQGMWWNYRKPRPLTSGSYKLAAQNNAPVLPLFITMADSDRVGADGFAVQEYTVHILEPIYPDPALPVRKNTELMKQKNYEAWKAVYERVYGVPLTYTTPVPVTYDSAGTEAAARAALER